MSRKVLFVHDGPRWKSQQGVQFGKTSDASFIERYSYLGDQITFLMRVLEIEDTKGLFNLNNQNVRIIEVPSFNRMNTLHHYFKAKKTIWESVLNHDLLVIRVPSTIGAIARKIAEKNRIPYLLEVVACPWDALTNYNLLGKLYAPFAYLKLKNCTKRALHTIYVTQHFLQKRYPNFRNNTDISDVILERMDQSVLYRKQFHYDHQNTNTFHLATMGAVDVPYKQQDTVMMAIAILNQRGYHFIYHIAGGGNPDRLKKITEKLNLNQNVVFEGVLPHEEVFRFLDQIDIYIQPSKMEGLPRALIEAMSRACVCIGTNTGGIPELLSDELIYTKGNANELADLLEQLATSNKMSLYALENYKKAENFQFHILEEKRKKFYDQFLKDVQ